jgi:hypothetical protein
MSQWQRESEAGVSSLGRNIPGSEQIKAIRRTAGDSEKGSWLKESEVRASISGRTILGVEQQTGPGSMRFSAEGPVTRTMSQWPRES